jgi:purine-binding chemotaxis protein CheW
VKDARGGAVVDRVRAQQAGDLVQFVSFAVGDGEYALDIMRIKEIINPVRVTRVPRAPAFIEGVVELRGAILPIVDMRKRFDLPVEETTRGVKYLIVAIDPRPKAPAEASASPPEPRAQRRMIVGLIVDRVFEPLRIPRDLLRPAPALTQGERPYFVGAVHHHGRILMILDLDAVLSTQEKLSLVGLRGQGDHP